MASRKNNLTKQLARKRHSLAAVQRAKNERQQALRVKQQARARTLAIAIGVK